ncbi:hypothetical protein CHLRE_09g386756v5 [Chlamydomonas reinhardtii]|uniref:Methyltransferase FkbM domain-containing protein n=1 Tax=Chlamydomonas reinhardtii TaxID=3055 RepID=A0A2K3DCH6_CHLRE|nr:uncharacterized protein CHLRE_09g386756v5 [Chlamydomonas reinhardtii]PNW78234.1 hypothetical protein CHLRE_09g386756v5 [Chlamydomonas reinhardtii]
MLRITSKFCHHPSQRRLVLDVGSNIGYFALLAAAQGCKAQAFDGSLVSLGYLHMSVALNQFQDRVQIFPALVSNTSVVTFDGWNVNAKGTTSPPGVTTDVIRIDDVAKEPVLYAKVDVEGWEPSAFATAHRLFTNPRTAPWYLFFELTYYLHEVRTSNWEVFSLLAATGYKCASRGLKVMLDQLPKSEDEFLQYIEKYTACTDQVRTNNKYCQDELFCVHNAAAWRPPGF